MPQIRSPKVLVAQGGGPTAVINQSLVGVVLEARRFDDVQLVYGARATACAASSTKTLST
jgi:ATP-dependent phosphofructokinase / diphosphate-dependent phosphofructokinase